MCINATFVCDGDFDCPDHSDEKRCGNIYALCPSIQMTFITSHVGIEPKCSSLQFKCSTNNQCIDTDLVCDEKWDCSQGEDEISCG